MFNLDPAKLLMVLVVALIVLGPDRLPKAARQLGAAWHEFHKLRDRLNDEVRQAMPDIDLPSIPRTGSIAGFVTGLTQPTRAKNDEPNETDDGEDFEPRPASGPSPAAAGQGFGTTIVHPSLGEVAMVFDDPSMN